MLVKEKRLICAIMILVLICLLFLSSVAFGQLSVSSLGNGTVEGYVFFNDSETPLVLDNTSGNYLQMINLDHDKIFNTTTFYWSPTPNYFEVRGSAANYTLNVFYKNKLIGTSPTFHLGNNTVEENLITNRMLTD